MYKTAELAADATADSVMQSCLRMGRVGRGYKDYVLNIPQFGMAGFPLFRHPKDDSVIFWDEGCQHWGKWAHLFFPRLKHHLRKEKLPYPKIIMFQVTPPNVWLRGCSWVEKALEDPRSRDRAFVQGRTLAGYLEGVLDEDRAIMDDANKEFRTRLAILQAETTDHALDLCGYSHIRHCFPDTLYANRGTHNGNHSKADPSLWLAHNGFNGANSPDLSPINHRESLRSTEYWIEEMGLQATGTDILDEENVGASYAAQLVYGLMVKGRPTTEVPWFNAPGTPNEGAQGLYTTRRQYLNRVMSIVREGMCEDCMIETLPTTDENNWTDILKAIGQP